MPHTLLMYYHNKLYCHLLWTYSWMLVSRGCTCDVLMLSLCPQAIDNESEEAVGEASAGLRESLDLLTRQTGSLCLTEKVMNHTLHSQVLTTSTSRGRVECGKPEEEGEFLTLKVFAKEILHSCMCYCVQVHVYFLNIVQFICTCTNQL